MLRRSIVRSLLLGIICFLLSALPWFQALGVQSAYAAGPSGGYKIVGYFPSWGIFGRSYNVSNIDASKVTHINYAFADICWNGKHGNGSQAPDNPNKQTWPCTVSGIPLQQGNVPNGSIVLGDPDADALRPTPGGPTTGCWADAACGNFGALRNLKQQNPHLKTILSVGGWTWSNRFSDTAATDQTRKNFAKSAVDALRAYGFDGVDLDWEYPNVEAIPGNSYRPEDKQNYTLLLKEVRAQLDAAGAADGKHYILTIASGASQRFVDNTELAQLAQILDWINIMTYDFHGGSFEATTSHNTGLYGDPADPYYNNKFFVDGAIQAYQQAGVPLNKLIVGLEFMGRSWKNCPPGPNGDGQFQTCTADPNSKWAPPGTWDDQTSGNTGVFDYGDIAANYVNKNGYTRYWNDIAKVPYVYNPSTKIFISYDDVQSIGYKTDYIKNKGLGGAMFWEFSSDCRTSAKYSCTGPKLLDKVTADLGTASPPIDTQQPTAPTNLVSPSHNDRSVTLSWGASTDNVGVSAYDIYNGSQLAATVNGATTTAIVKGLAGSTAYTFTVKARDYAGNVSAASNAVTVTTDVRIVDNEPPTVPANLSSPGKTKTSVTLSWDASTDNDELAGYDIYQDGVKVKSTANTTETVTGLQPGTTYSFTVKAKDVSGNESAASASLSVTTKAEPNFPAWQSGKAYVVGDYVTYNGKIYKCTYAHTSNPSWDPPSAPTLWQLQSGDVDPQDTVPPTAPANLTASGATTSSITLSWSASTDNIGVTGYDIYQGTAKVGSTAATSHTVSGLTANTPYTFTVKAKDAAGNVSAASAPVTASTLGVDTQAPTAPENLALQGVTSTTVTLTWSTSTDNVGVTGYDVYNGAMLAKSVNGSTLTAVVDGLTPNTPYTFTVKAKDAAGNVSAASNAVTVTTSAPPSDTQAPTAPTSLASPGKTSTTVTLTWGASTDNVGVTDYDVYNGGTLAKSVSGTTLTAVIDGLAANTTYTFTVKARDAAGNVSPASSAVSVTTDPVSSGAPAWEANHAYVANDLVTYGGKTYKCVQPHTSLPGWEPSNVPALWSLQP